MKELSIEEKAKAYDEVVEKAKNCLKDGTITNTAISYIETLIPELKECEDERIMKALYKMAKVPRKEIYEAEGITKEQALAWLEKQGEQKLTEFEKTVKQVMEEAIECGDTHNLKADADMLLSLVHKSAWSEEDEEMLNSFLHKLEVCDLLSNKEGIWIKNKLKALKDRVQLQSTWKPSEEQIKAVKEAACYSSVFSEKTIDNLIQLSKQLKEIMGE